MDESICFSNIHQIKRNYIKKKYCQLGKKWCLVHFELSLYWGWIISYILRPHFYCQFISSFDLVLWMILNFEHESNLVNYKNTIFRCQFWKFWQFLRVDPSIFWKSTSSINNLYPAPKPLKFINNYFVFLYMQLQIWDSFYKTGEINTGGTVYQQVFIISLYSLYVWQLLTYLYLSFKPTPLPSAL